MTNLVDLNTYRRTGKCVPPIQHDAKALEAARALERMMDAMERVYEGRLPARYADEAGKPCDTDGDAA